MSPTDEPPSKGGAGQGACQSCGQHAKHVAIENKPAQQEQESCCRRKHQEANAASEEGHNVDLGEEVNVAGIGDGVLGSRHGIRLLVRFGD